MPPTEGLFFPLLSDAEIRRSLLAYLCSSQPSSARLFQEVGLCQGEARPDLLVVNGALHGFEIKSDRDTLKRLQNQIQVYSDVLELVTIVVTQRHLQTVKETVPSWWGLLTASRSSKGVLVRTRRTPKVNPARDPYAIAQLLWRNEALALLAERELANGVRSKPRTAIWRRLAEVVELTELSSLVGDALCSRHNWQCAS